MFCSSRCWKPTPQNISEEMSMCPCRKLDKHLDLVVFTTLDDVRLCTMFIIYDYISYIALRTATLQLIRTIVYILEFCYMFV